MVSNTRSDVGQSFAAFATWLRKNPLAGDRIYGASSVRYQVARYCDYLDANPWPKGDPLRDPAARDGAIRAYGLYLDTFETPAAFFGAMAFIPRAGAATVPFSLLPGAAAAGWLRRRGASGSPPTPVVHRCAGKTPH